MGRRIAVVVGERLGRTLLELGGNNAIIVMDDADPDLAVRAVLFGAVGTRRAALHDDAPPDPPEGDREGHRLAPRRRRTGRSASAIRSTRRP